MTYTVETPDLERLISEFKKFPDLFIKYSVPAMKQSVIAVEGDAKANAPVGVSGRLRNSFASKVEATGSDIVGRVGSTLTEPYPLVMELGRRPGATPPPVSAMLRWVHIVMGFPEEAAYRVAKVGARGWWGRAGGWCVSTFKTRCSRG